MKKIITIVVIVFIVAAAAGLIWQRKNQTNVSNSKIITSIDRGIDAVNQKKLQDKIAEITGKLGDSRDVKDFNQWIDLGNYKNILGDLSGAKEAYTVAAELNDLSYIAWGNLGDTLAEMGDLANAEKAYLKTIQLVDLEAYYEKYANFLRAYYPNRKTDYENLLLQSVKVLGQQPIFISRLAQFYEEQGRYAEAKTHFELLVSLEPDNEGTKEDLARVIKEIEEQK